MEHRLQLLESFAAKGADGREYKVRAYEHQVHDATWLHDGRQHWESTGETEYRLDNGERLDVRPDGSMCEPNSGLELRVH